MKTKLFLLGVSVITIVSCGTSRKTLNANKPFVMGNDVEVIRPCSGPEFKSNREFLRADAVGESNNMEIANQKALISARAKLASNMELILKATTDQYFSSYDKEQVEMSSGKFETLISSVVNQKLSNTKVICEKLLQSPEGKYKSFVVVEISVNDIIEEVESYISADSKKKIDLDKSEFAKILYERTSKLEKE